MPNPSDWMQKIFQKKLEITRATFNRLAAEVEKLTLEHKKTNTLSVDTEIKMRRIFTELKRLEAALSNPSLGVCSCGNSIELVRIINNPSTCLCAACDPSKQNASVLPFIKKTS
ncbi:MAG: hypothetical protein AAB906_00845 [Patescibacteria group bacterium]